MNMRFSTQAANADILGEVAPNATNATADAGADKAARPRAEPKARPRTRGGARREDEVRPGKDINAPGFVRDRDAGKP